MGLNSLGLGFVFTAKDLASGTMRRVQGQFTKLDATTSAAAKSFTKNVGTMVAGLGVLTAGAVGLGTAFSLAGKFGSYEKKLAKVGAITRATADEMKMLDERALRAGIETQFSPDEAVGGLSELGVRGFNAAQAAKALGGALDFAAGGEISVAQAAATTGAALRVFGKDADFATEAADKLLKISNVTALQAHELETALGSVARGAIMGKQGIDEMLVSVGLVRNAGAEASKAANSVSSGMQFMGKNMHRFKELGVELDKPTGELKNYLDIVWETGQAMDKAGLKGARRLAKSADLFGRFGQLGAAAAYQQLTTGVQTLSGEMLTGRNAIQYLREEMETAKGTAEKFRKQILDTFEGQKILLQGSLQTLAVEMGRAFAQVLKPVVSGVIHLVNSLISVITKIPAPIKRVLGGAFILVSAIVALTGAVIAGAAAFSLIKMAVIAFAGPLIMLGKVLAVAVGAGLLLAGVFLTLKKAYDANIGGLGDKIDSIASRVKLFFGALQQLTTGDGKLRGNVLQQLLEPANSGVLSLVQRFQQLRHRIGRFIDGIKDGFSEVMAAAGPTFSALGDALNELFAALGFGADAFGLITSSSKDWAASGKTIGEVVGNLARLFVNGLTIAVRLATGAVHAFRVAWKVLKPILLTTWAVIYVLGQVVSGILSIFVDLSDNANTTGGAFDYLSKTIGFAIGIWISLKGVVMVARTAMLAYHGAVLAVNLAQKAFAAGSILMKAATAHPLAAAAALGLTLGTVIDQYLGISDAMADYFVSLTKEGKAVAKLEEAYRKTLKVRGQIAAFDSIEAAAKAQGKNVLDYADERASKIAGESQAKALGLSKEEVKRRLLEGEEIYQKKDYDKVEAEQGVEVIRTAANGEADKQKAAVSAQADAFEAALMRAEKAGKPVRFEANFNVDKQRMAQMVKEANMSADALDFEVSTELVGG